MNNFRLLFQIFLVIVFLAGIYVLVWFDGYSKKEGFVTTTTAAITTSSPTTTNSVNYTTTSGSVVVGPDGTVYTVSGTSLVDTKGNSFLPDSNGYIIGVDRSIFDTDPNGNYYSIDNNNAIYNSAGDVIQPDGISYVLGPDATFYFVDATNVEFMDVSDNIYPADSTGNITGIDGSLFNMNPSGTYYGTDANKIVYDYTGTSIVPDGVSSVIGPDGTFYFVDANNVAFVDINLNNYAADERGNVIGLDGSLFNINPSGTYYGVDTQNTVYDFTGSVISPDGINVVVGPDQTFYFVDPTNINLVDVNLNVYTQNNPLPEDGGEVILSRIIVGADNSRFSSMPPDNIYYSVDTNNVVYDFTGVAIIPDGMSSIIGPDGTFYFIITATDPDGNANISFMTTSNQFFYANSDGVVIGLDGSTFQKDKTGVYYSTNLNGYIFGPDGIIRGEMPITMAPMTTAYAAPVETPIPVANNDLYTFPPMLTLPPDDRLLSRVTERSNSVPLTTTTLSPQNIDNSYSGSVNAQNDFTFPPAQITDNSSYSNYDPLTSGDISKYEYVSKTDGSTQPDGLSDNPMDPNWGGVMYTQKMLDSGKYNDNIITKPILFQPKGLFLPGVPSAINKPKDIY